MSTTENFAEQIGYRKPTMRDVRDVVRAPHTADDVARGVRRALIAESFSPICEFSLSNNRRLDVAAVGADGSVLGVEIKVSVADLKADDKWPDYLTFCDLFYFAVPPEFPQALLPVTMGLIVADRFGGSIVRPAVRNPINPSRRRALVLKFAQCAADRLTRMLDPAC